MNDGWNGEMDGWNGEMDGWMHRCLDDIVVVSD